MRWLAAVLSLLWCFPAFAGVTLVPSPPLLGDGSTAATVRFYVDDGQKLKVKAESGKVGPAVAGADGVWTIPYTPPRVATVGTVAFKVTAGGAETTFEVPVVPPFAGSVDISFDPPVLSSTGTATIKITPEGSSPVAADARRFVVVASAGTVESVVPAGGGTWVARYTPPKGLTAPLSVVFGAADAAAPDKVFGSAVLPVTVKRSVSFDVQAGSSNVLKVGSRQYGPVVAAPSGKVAFDVDLDPREPKGDLRSVNTDTSKVDKEVELPVSAATALTFLPLPATVPAQADLQVPVRLVVIGSDGEQKTAGTQIKLTASAGTISTPVLERAGYSATFTPPATPGEVTLTAEVDGVKAERKLKLIGSVPTVALTAPDIGKSATTFSVTARVKDAQGTGVIGKTPIVSAEGATSGGSAKDNKDGTYTFPFKVASSVGRVRVYATPALEVSSMPAARIVAWPSSPTVAANGTDVVTVTVVTVDTFGIPVAGVDLKVGAPKGDGAVPPSAKTDARGMARVSFTAGRTPGLASVRLEGAGLITEIPLFQVKDGAGVVVPPSGNPADEQLVARWQGAAAELRLVREGVVPPSGPPAVVTISTIPPYTTPGAAILVNVRVADAAGVGVGGKKLTVTAAPATVGQVTDNRDGTYAFPIQLPAGTDGPVGITIGVDSATGSLALPTLATVAAQPQAASAGPARATGGGTPTTGGAGRPARVAAPADAEWSKLRIGATLLNARGSYTQSSDAGAQLLGAADYATPGAGFFGLGVDALYMPLQASWGGLGVDFRGRGQLEWFSVGDAPYINVQRDVLLGARYRRGFGALFSVEGSLAFHYTTGVLFRYADAARTQAELLNFPLFGGRLGVLATLESDRIWATVEFAETFAPFPIDTHAEANVDVRLGSGGTAIRAGGAWDYRHMAYAAGETGDSGEATVQQQQFTVKLGAAQVF